MVAWPVLQHLSCEKHKWVRHMWYCLYKNWEAWVVTKAFQKRPEGRLIIFLALCAKEIIRCINIPFLSLTEITVTWPNGIMIINNIVVCYGIVIVLQQSHWYCSVFHTIMVILRLCILQHDLTISLRLFNLANPGNGEGNTGPIWFIR